MLSNVLNLWKTEPTIRANIVSWRREDSSPGIWAGFPAEISSTLKQALQEQGILQLYLHQAESWKLIRDGKNVVIVTSPSSGKSLCYNMVVLNALLEDPSTTALYIFPTKALAQDQKSALLKIARSIPPTNSKTDYPGCIITYDGDTPVSHRTAARSKARILITNPDMLHTGILPHHTLWDLYFHNLRYIILDEVHTYRGIFGSNIANVIRRLKRIAAFYGSEPQFILTSATIANPLEHATRLIEKSVEIVQHDTSPHGVHNLVLYNPPIVDTDLGLRRSAAVESARLADDLISYDAQTLVFTRSRKPVELLLRNIRDRVGNNADKVHGYRAGYLPSERRIIENGLSSGSTRCVVATNALELGVDIGGMDSILMVGFPGTIASFYQQAGRAGRRINESLAALIASSGPLDQFLMLHPDYVFNQSPERAFINPDNLLILFRHMHCAAFELPFQNNEGFGNVSREVVQDLLKVMLQEGSLVYSGGRCHWAADQYPAQQISLRSASSERVLLMIETETTPKTIGEVDIASARWMVHPEAIYLHEGSSYYVEDLDLEKHIARLRTTDVDYYTEPKTNETIECLGVTSSELVAGGKKWRGEILVTSQLTGYRKIRWFSNEILENVTLTLPSTTLQTTAFWLNLTEQTISHLSEKGLWRSTSNNYGNEWQKIRDIIRRRDHYTCQVCGIVEKDQRHHVHHKIPFKNFTSSDVANQFNNLITLCPQCHQRAETTVRVRSGLAGLGYIIHNLSPLFLMCDAGDLGSHIEYECLFTERMPTVIIYDQVPAGIGLSEEIYNLYSSILTSAYDLVLNCPCKEGCPSCVGPSGSEGGGAKAETVAILSELCRKVDE